MQLSLSIHPGELFVEVVSKNILQLWYVLGIVKWNQIYFRKLVDREVYPVFVTKIGILQFWCCQLFMLYRRDLQFSVKKYLMCSCSVLFKIFKLFIYLLIFFVLWYENWYISLSSFYLFHKYKSRLTQFPWMYLH